MHQPMYQLCTILIFVDEFKQGRPVKRGEPNANKFFFSQSTLNASNGFQRTRHSQGFEDARRLPGRQELH